MPGNLGKAILSVLDSGPGSDPEPESRLKWKSWTPAYAGVTEKAKSSFIRGFRQNSKKSHNILIFQVPRMKLKEYSCLALLGLGGEDKLRPYEFNHVWGNSRRG